MLSCAPLPCLTLPYLHSQVEAQRLLAFSVQGKGDITDHHPSAEFSKPGIAANLSLPLQSLLHHSVVLLCNNTAACS